MTTLARYIDGDTERTGTVVGRGHSELLIQAHRNDGSDGPVLVVHLSRVLVIVTSDE